MSRNFRIGTIFFDKKIIFFFTSIYIGRIKIEKGIFSLIEIFKKLEINASLSIVAAGKIGTSKQMEDKNIKFFEFNNVNDSIIKFYDEHNIFVLP